MGAKVAERSQNARLFALLIGSAEQKAILIPKGAIELGRVLVCKEGVPCNKIVSQYYYHLNCFSGCVTKYLLVQAHLYFGLISDIA